MASSVAEAIARLGRLTWPRIIYERAKHEIETEGLPAIEKWLPSDPLRALQALREEPLDGPKPCSQRKTPPADEAAQRKPRSIPGGEAVDGTVVQLPVWPETMSACPSCVLRSALFGVVRRGWRKAVEGAEIAAWKRVTIRYTGWRLDQGDLDVWEAVLRLATNQTLGAPRYFTESGLLRDTGRQYGKRNKEWLWSSLRRLKACAVEIETPRYRYIGSLIDEAAQDKEGGKFYVKVNAQLTALFAGGYTLNDWETRKALKHDLSKWLLGYIESHEASASNPHRIGLGKLKALCGSEAGELWKFRQATKEAMDELNGIGVVHTWKLTESDAIEFSRPLRVKK